MRTFPLLCLTVIVAVVSFGCRERSSREERAGGAGDVRGNQELSPGGHRSNPNSNSSSGPIGRELGAAHRDVDAMRTAGTETIPPMQADGASTEFVDDPSTDGWISEAISAEIQRRLDAIALLFHRSPSGLDDRFSAFCSEAFRASCYPPADGTPHYSNGAIRVFRHPRSTDLPVSRREFAASIEPFAARYSQYPDARHKVKVTRIDADRTGAESTVLFELTGSAATESWQHTAEWRCRWERVTGELQLTEIEVTHGQSVHCDGKSSLFTEFTASVLGPELGEGPQLARSSAFWAGQIETRIGSDLMGHHGLAIGDLNGDHLDDLYVCQPGGVPNLVLIQNRDGTVSDRAADWGLDILDATRSALILDLDNDGDQDVVLATVTGLFVLAQEPGQSFRLTQRVAQCARAYSLTSADYDGDRLLDLYVCLYHPPLDAAVSNPLPYYDANNGSPNVLLRNTGGAVFTDETRDSGLDVDNRRWSYAAAWHDYDRDGDVDLYVANDFGRNCLYQNHGGKFRNVAADAGVEDIASGMSVAWGDYDRDGWDDIYVSNMFSSAGGRITFQRKFKHDANATTKGQIQRLARGNSLFHNEGDGTFEDRTLDAGVAMGRWAWSSLFVDVNNDTWQDLLITNGNVTGDDTGDL